ncbi:hypothetical protein [Sphingomonas sp. AX6]|uniref:hypothetical protein n=1 Tax=Sphingomonas sp. AX6 TaxID=2653171 RepID=UPI0012F12D83|nr:hypothetical protein [Sphingomonas sp. AX6]VXC74391.1 conserved hypothetical protein [Sphingomonas sp. AX6]
MLNLVVASAMVQGALFAPPLDREFAYVTEQVRSDPGGERRYRIERTLRFARDGDGLFADLTLDRIVGGNGEEGAMFERALAGLKGRTVRYRLTPQGTLGSIDAIDGHWTALVDGMSIDATGTRGAPVVASLRVAPRRQRVAMLWSMLDPLVIPAIAADGPYALRPVSLPGRSANGTAATLVGTERLERTGGRALRLTRIVRGSEPMRAGTERSPGTTIDRERETVAILDSQSGLLSQSTDRTSVRIGDREQVSITKISLAEK